MPIYKPSLYKTNLYKTNKDLQKQAVQALPAAQQLQQMDAQGNLKHLICAEGLSSELMERLFVLAESFLDPKQRGIVAKPLLQNKVIINLFFESSTRTRTTFELAARALGASVVNIDTHTSSASKGESLIDTIANLHAMFAHILVIRHPSSSAADFIARHVAKDLAVINAGSGCYAHPTQALLDMFTIRQIKKDFASLKVAIVGDIVHSRVARCQIHALHILGVKAIRVVAPKTLLPKDLDTLGVQVFQQIDQALAGVDVIIVLRLQHERMVGTFLPSLAEYYQHYGINRQRLALADAHVIVMHPGPINRGVEIEVEVADGPHSVILKQVSNGIAVRMAVMALTQQGAIA